MTGQGHDQPTIRNAAHAEEIVWKTVEEVGGTRSIYRNPRQAFSARSRRMLDVDGFGVEVRYGEVSTPAIVTVDGWVYEIHDDDIELLIKPRPKPGS